MKRQLTPQLFEAVDHHNRGSFTEVRKEHFLLQVYPMLSRLRGVVLELFTQIEINHHFIYCTTKLH